MAAYANWQQQQQLFSFVIRSLLITELLLIKVWKTEEKEVVERGIKLKCAQ